MEKVEILSCVLRWAAIKKRRKLSARRGGGKGFQSGRPEQILERKRGKNAFGTRFPSSCSQLSFEGHKLAARHVARPSLSSWLIFTGGERRRAVTLCSRSTFAAHLSGRERGERAPCKPLSRTRPLSKHLMLPLGAIGSPLIPMGTRPKRNPRRRNTVSPSVCPAIKFPPTSSAVSFSRHLDPSWNLAGPLTEFELFRSSSHGLFVDLLLDFVDKIRAFLGGLG